MKRTLIALAVLALLGGPAFALTLAGGEYVAKFRDESSLYDAQGNPIGFPAGTLNEDPPPTYLPTSVFVEGDMSELGITQRTIFQLTSIIDADQNIVYSAPSTTEYTGIIVDLLLTHAHFDSPSEVVLDFSPISVTLVNGTSEGGILSVFEDSGTTYDPDPGTNVGNLQNALPAGSVAIPADGGPNDWGAGYTFPTVTDGSLWLGARLVDLAALTTLGVLQPDLGNPIPDGTVLRETINVSSGTGGGFAYADVYTGSFLSLIVQGYVKDQFGNPTLADLALQFDLYTPIFNTTTGNWQDTLSYVGPGYWPVDSQDPASFAVVPEPMTIGLIGLGLAGLGLRRRKA